MPTPGLSYTNAAAITTRMSQVAIDLRTDDLALGEGGGSETDGVNQAIQDASTEVDGYCLNLYSAAALQSSPWVELRARSIAIYFLCLRRLNSATDSVMAEYERSIGELEKVLSGSLRIPGLAMSRATVPVMSNQGVRLDPIPHEVVDLNRSTGPAPIGYVQRVDRGCL